MSHIKVRHGRSGKGRGLYWHHGIRIGENTVIDFGGRERRKGNKKVRRVSMSEFVGERPVGFKEVHYEPGETFNRDTIIQRAEARLYHGFGEYDVVSNNCEHFAVWVMTNRSRSSQVERVVVFMKDFASGFLDGLTFGIFHS